MRCIPVLASCAVLIAGDVASLRQLEEKHRIFELRAELDHSVQSSADVRLYRAIVASRFGSEREAIGQFRAFLALKPSPDMERKARFELSSALTRLGEYGQAANELAAVLRLPAGGETSRADIENGRALLDALSGVAKQTIEFGPPTTVRARRNQLGLWEVPVEIQGKRGDWIFDSGANFSTVSESEARRMGLPIRDVQAFARGYTGAKIAVRLAVASDLRFGPALAHNVVFLVLTDQALPVPTGNYTIRGILGLPVMRALECVEISGEGVVTIDRSAKPAQVAPNVFFDGLNPIVQVFHSGHGLQMMLDTGARVTSLYPSVRDTLAQWERNQLAGAAPGRAAGAGGSEKWEADFVPSIQLDILNKAVYLQRLGLLKNTPAGVVGRDGVLGIDALNNGFRLDFRVMQFAIK